MTPKEKAEELFDKYWFPHYTWENDAYQVDEKLTYEVRKRFALVAVDEIISANPHSNPLNTDVYSTMDYWQEIKKEIEKL